ncbi:MAG: LPS export ABC transporter ATP-binding protein [bacterium]|nr:LPS export ABC transporter ATP-binding protein [bacterium]
MRLETKNLVKTYGKRTVVKDVSFEISQGEVVGLLGSNGAGKTTSFYMVVGVVRPTQGQIFLDEKEITGLPMYQRARQGIGYLPQEASVFRKMSVEENLLSILETLGLSKAEQKGKADKILDELHIQHIRKNMGYSLSGGERRRVEIARALVTDPAFILLDEPFAGVDPIAVIDIQGVVKELAERNIGVLITDHNVRETLGIVDRAYIMNDGEILVAGKPQEIIENETARKVYLGEHFSL